MANVREFWLENSVGETYSLHTCEVFLHNPEGLGYTVDLSTLRLGDSNMIISDEYNLGSVVGELLFMEDRPEAYQEYYNFIQFLYKKPITLHYRTPNTFDSYFCYVRVVEVNKTEMKRDRILRVPISMYRQTLWYTDEQNKIVVNHETEEGKHYLLDRPYHYGKLSTSDIEVYNNGANETPILVEIDGTATSPMYSIYDDNLELYGRTRIIGTYDYISVDSDDLNENIALLRNGSLIPNSVNYQDLTVGDPRKVFVTFIKLKPGKSYFVFNFDDDFDGTVSISWRNAYVTV